MHREHLKIDFSLVEAAKRILTLALPMAGSQLINVASGFLCMAMLAQLGHQVLAASGLIFTTQVSIMVSGMSILFSLGVLVGNAYGAKDYPTIGKYVQQSWILGLLISIPIIILFLHLDSALVFFGQSKEIADIVQLYSHAFAWAVLPGLLSCCNQQFGYAVHKKTLIISISAISVIILLITAWVLIFGKLGMPKMGVAGLGYATVAQYWFFFISTTLFFYCEKSFGRFELFKHRAYQHREHFIQMFKIGWPICVQMGGEMLSFFVGGIMIGWIGTTALAALQIVNQYYFLIVIPIFSLSQAIGILVGHARGARRFHEMKKLSYASIAIAFAASLLVACVFFIFPRSLASFYMDVSNPENMESLRLTILVFMVVAFSQFFDSLRNILIGILRGLFDTRFSMVMCLLSIWLVGMPLSCILAFQQNLGAVGFVIGSTLGMFVGAVSMAYRWYVLIKRY